MDKEEINYENHDEDGVENLVYWTRRMAARKKQRMKQTRKRMEMRIEVLGGRSALTLGS